VQQRLIVARTFLARVPERLIALRPLLMHTRAEISDHACVTIRGAAGSCCGSSVTWITRAESEQAEPGRVWTTVPRSVVSDASATRRTTGVAPARNQTVLKRLLRRIVG
jgi:hypothetical protein